MRQVLGQKKTNRLRKETGLDIEKVFVRGGTNHRKDLCLKDGSITHMLESGEMQNNGARWTN